MSNAKRHAFGIPVGLVAGPISLGLLAYGVHAHATLGTAGGAAAASPLGMTCLVAGGLLAGMLAAARWASPLAALLAGVLYTGLGAALLPPLATDLTERGVLSTAAETVGTTPWQALLAFGQSGMLLAVGVLLLITSLLPNRWRGRPTPQPAAEETAADVDSMIVGTGTSITPDPDRTPLPRRPATADASETTDPGTDDGDETKTTLKATAST